MRIVLLLLLASFCGVLAAQPVIEVRETTVGGTVIAHNDPATSVRAFGSVAVAGGTGVATIFILNTGAANLNVGTPTATTGTDFSASTAGFPAVVVPTGNISFTITFNPASLGAKTDTITFTHDDGTVTTPFIINVSGTGTNTAPVLASPTSGGITVGGADPTFTGTITVGGNLAVTFNATDADTADTLTTTTTVTGGTLSAPGAGFTGFAGVAFIDPAPGVSPHGVSLAGTAANPGTIELTVSVSDGTTTDQYTLTITISAGNTAPVLGAPTSGGITVGGADPAFTGAITVGGNLAISFPATDANAGDTLTTTVTVTGGSLSAAAAGFTGFSGATFVDPAPGVSPHGLSLAGTALAAGTITLNVSVSDGTVNDSYSIAITITAGNAAPVLGTPTSASVTIGGVDPAFTGSVGVGASLAVTFPATDVNAADTLTTTVTVTGGTLTAAAAGFTGFSGATFSDPAPGVSPHSVSLAGTSLAAGTITLTVSVSDGTVTDQYTLAITITSGNSAPVLTAPTSGAITIGGADPNFTGAVNVGASLAVAFAATDANAGDTLTTTVTVTGGTLTAATAGFSGFTGATATDPTPGVSPHNRALAGTALAAGTITLTISVSDGTVTDQYTLAITISTVAVGSITVSSPNGGEVRIISSNAVITWANGGGFTGNVDIHLSTDSGATYPTVVATNIANAGIFNWIVPNLPGALCRIRVRASAGGTPTDESNANFTIQAGTLTGVLTDAGGSSGAQSANPGEVRRGLHFALVNDVQSPTAFTVTSVGVAIATNDNASNTAIARLASVRLYRGNNSATFGGVLIATVVNSGTGWTVAGTTINITFGNPTPLGVAVGAGQSQDFWVEYVFTNITVIGTPNPTYSCRIDNTTGSAINGGGTSAYPGVVQGGSVTLTSSIPGDPFSDKKDDNSCELAAQGSPAWPMFALLCSMLACLIVGRRKEKRGVR